MTAHLTKKPLPSAELEEILAADERLWRSTRGARFLILGGAGFFATWMIESLLHANRRLNLGLRLDVLTRSPQSFRDRLPHAAENKALRALDYQATADEPYDFALHLAYEIDERLLLEPEAAPHLPGVERLRNLASKNAGARMLYASSGCVYGAPAAGQMRWRETDARQPVDANGRSKKFAEDTLRSSGCVMARGFAFAGPGLALDGGFAFGNFLADALAGRAIHINGDGRPLRSYLYASEMATWLWRLLFTGRAGEAYNVGAETSVSIAGLAEAMAASLAPKLAIEIAQEPQAGEAPRYLPDCAKARIELGLEATIDLPTAIARHAEWLRQ